MKHGPWTSKFSRAQILFLFFSEIFGVQKVRSGERWNCFYSRLIHCTRWPKAFNFSKWLTIPIVMWKPHFINICHFCQQKKFFSLVHAIIIFITWFNKDWKLHLETAIFSTIIKERSITRNCWDYKKLICLIFSMENWLFTLWLSCK